MKEVEEFDELKRSLMKRAQYQGSEVPPEVLSAVNEAFVRLSDMYENYMGRSSRSISEYADGNFREIRVRINKLQEGRNDDQLGQLQEILNRMEHALEEIEELEGKEGVDQSELGQEKEKEQNHTREGISALDMRTRHIVQRTMDQLQDALADVRSMARRTMSNNGFSERRMEQIDDEARRMIISLLNSREEKIFETFNAADRKLINDVLREYDQYVEMSRRTEHQRFAAQYEVSKDELTPIPPRDEKAKQEEREQQSNSLPKLDSDYII